ncbi:hypothetical protein [Actinoplanes subtropicus]|uniref:hypothetical protein n=1 Tax=Actinoplanes subtropicus TaxID=543632 RepID=UPI0004C3A36F|nr:hypothetical protein [Actinoplanes subtropicus]
MGRLLRVEGLVPVSGAMAFLLLFGLLGGPGDPSPVAPWVGLGVLVAPAFMVYAHRGAAAWAGVLAAVVWTSLAHTAAAALVCWAYALVAIALTRRDRSPVAALVPRRQPPAPDGLPQVAVPAEVLGIAVLALAAAGFVAVLARYAGPAWLVAVIGGFGFGCALLARVVTHRTRLRQLFGAAQPMHAVRVVEQIGYVHVLLPHPGGLIAREFGFDTTLPPRPPQPLASPSEILAQRDNPPSQRANSSPSEILAQRGNPSPQRPHSSPSEILAQRDTAGDQPRTLAGTLYGDPRPGAWCTVEVEGRIHVPVSPVGRVIEVAYDVVQGLPREIEDDEEQLVDPAALRPGDRGADAYQCREHRIAPQRAWVATVAIGLGAALAAGELAMIAGVPPAVLTLVAAVSAGLGYEFGWRTQLRPRLRWHVGGVAAVGFRGPDRQPWATDSAVVHDDAGTVLLTAGESVLTVPVPPPWPSPDSQRNADELVAALRDARNRSFAISPLPPPPAIEVPGRPWPLYLAWLASVGVTLLILFPTEI